MARTISVLSEAWLDLVAALELVGRQIPDKKRAAPLLLQWLSSGDLPSTHSGGRPVPCDEWTRLDIRWHESALVPALFRVTPNALLGIPAQVERAYHSIRIPRNQLTQLITRPDAQPNAVFRRKRGRKPDKLPRVVKQMHTDLAGDELTPGRLKAMTEKDLVARYDAARDTVRKARNQVLALFDD